MDVFKETHQAAAALSYRFEIKKIASKFFLIMISVIVPIYNAEGLLPRCIDSILNQTYQDFELLLVDDGSQDGSSSICERYCKEDNRVRYYRQANQGVSVARNKGLEMAQGEYISFVDADDFVDNGFLKAFAEALRDENTDICIQGYNCMEFGNCVMPYSHVTERDDIFRKSMTLNDRHLLGYVWNKLFRKDIIRNNHIQFNPIVTLREDLLFVMQYLLYCNDMVVLSDVWYYYCDDGTHNYSFSAFNQSLDLTFDFLSKIDRFPDDEKKYFLLQEYRLSLYVIHILYTEKHYKPDRVSYLKKIKERFEDLKNDKYFSERVYAVLSYMMHHFPLFLNDLIFTCRYAK